MQWLLCRQRRERSSQCVGVCEVPSAHADIRLEAVWSLLSWLLFSCDGEAHRNHVGLPLDQSQCAPFSEHLLCSRHYFLDQGLANYNPGAKEDQLPFGEL